MNTTEALSIACAIVPDREAVVFQDHRLSFQALQDNAVRLANCLSELGVGPGDRVATMDVNRPELLEVYFAAASLDAVYVPLSFRAKEEELAYMLESSSPSVLLVGDGYLELASAALANASVHSRLIGLSHQYGDLLAAALPDQMHFPEAGDSDTTVLMYTAGTTGVPKGVMLSHDSLTTYLLANVEPPDPDAHESNLLPMPLYHIGGFQTGLAAVYGGRTLVLMQQFDAEQWLELAQRERPTRSILVPTMLKQLIEHPAYSQYDLSSLKVVTYGAAPMPQNVIRRAIEALPGVQFINAFGQTESAATIAMLGPDDHALEGPPEEVEKKLRRLSSIGRPLDDVEVMLVDDDGQPVAQGEVGEIVARGPRIMSGYWQQQSDTAETIKGGWLHTGDLAYQDEDGYIFLAGRAKDFIKRGGEMVSPEEVERVLTSHPSVDEAAIIGVPDDYWGERVRAVVVPTAAQVDEAELIEYCRERLSSFKRPESVVFVDELPRNPLGKVLKTELRQQFGHPV